MNEQNENNLDQSGQSKLSQNGNLEQVSQSKSHQGVFDTNSKTIEEPPMNLDKGSAQEEKRGFERYIIIIVAVIPSLLLLGILAWIFWPGKCGGIINPKPPEKCPRPQIVELKESNNSGVDISKISKNEYKIKYSVGGIDEFFNLNTTDKDIMARSLSQLREDESYSPFYESTINDSGKHGSEKVIFGRNVIDVTLDVSKSVRDVANGDIAYYDNITNRLNEIISSVNLRPGDLARVRFIGANKYYGGSTTIKIEYVGPKFLYEQTYQETSNRNIIRIKGVSLDGEPVRSSRNYEIAKTRTELSNKIVTIYKGMLENPRSYAMETYFLGPMINIISDNKNINDQIYNSITYIILTDGEFHIEDSLQYIVGVGYCDEKTYGICHQRIIDNANKILRGSLSLGDSGDDRVFFIGLNYEDDPIYRFSMELMMREMFKPITDIKFN